MKKTEKSSEYRKLTSVDELLRDERTAGLRELYSHSVVSRGLRSVINNAREKIAYGEAAPDSNQIIADTEKYLSEQTHMSLRKAINATGIIIHTGLGRAVLPNAAVEAIKDVATGHSILEVDIATGKRGSRQDHVINLLTDITDAQNALVVNNNAAAVILAVNTLASGGDVVISRGQLVEIGGSFRLPDIIKRAGARLVEVGTTNRTRISDYGDAITSDTRLILRCHPSNFKISGFTEEADLRELVSLGKEYGLPVMDDLGSGALLDLTQFGLAYEPTVQESVKAGVDLISFSGDKLLGASQAGILLGRADLIEKFRKNPLARALRIDKLNLAALEAALRIYRDADPITQIPVLIAISRSINSIAAQARKLARDINKLGMEETKASVVKTISETGGGSLPEQSLESHAIALKSGSLSAEDLSKHFRRNEPPIFGRIEKDVFLLDMRTVSPKEVSDILGCALNLMG